ncbi:AraC family transcriptional regulator [Paenibacillus sp. CN-4]|uniref:AraC family transcriptional regulator n=1 Tax=Paenibacillus nanchangensis TaxID=3348343 RepID=UPI00397D099F
MRKVKKEEPLEVLENYHFTVTELEKSSAVWPVSAGRDVSQANSRIGPRVVPYFYLIFVLEGQGEYIYKQKKYVLRKSDMFCLFPHVVHEYHIDKDTPLHKMWVALEGPQAVQLLERVGIKSCTPHVPNASNEGVLNLLRSLFEFGNHSDKRDFDLCRLIILHKIFEELSRNTPDALRNAVCSDYWLQQAKEYIERHYTDRLTIEQIADYVHVNRAYFSRKFNQAFGISPAKYLLQLKIEESKQLLVNTGYNLSIIAQSIGYTDMFTFSKVFKKATGVSPREYRLLKQSERI